MLHYLFAYFIYLFYLLITYFKILVASANNNNKMLSIGLDAVLSVALFIYLKWLPITYFKIKKYIKIFAYKNTYIA